MGEASVNKRLLEASNEALQAVTQALEAVLNSNREMDVRIDVLEKRVHILSAATRIASGSMSGTSIVPEDPPVQIIEGEGNVPR